MAETNKNANIIKWQKKTNEEQWKSIIWFATKKGNEGSMCSLQSAS